MLRYGLYRHYFPLMALGRAVRARKAARRSQGAELSRAFMAK
jgi:hypothetical protein